MTTDIVSALKRVRLPGRLSDPDPFDLSLTVLPANKEAILMTKSEDKNDQKFSFDFSSVSDDVKTALALGHKAIEPHLSAMPEPIVEFYKSAKDQLKFEDTPISTDDKTDDDKSKADAELIQIVKSALPGVIEKAQEAVAAPLKVEIQKAQEQINTLLGIQERDEMRQVAQTLTLSDEKPTDEQVDMLITIKKSMQDDQWTKYLEGQRSHIAMIQKSALFETQSNPAAVGSGSAFEELNSIANSIIEKSEVKDPSKAWETAISQNPKLYQRYRNEQNAQAKAADQVAA